VHRSNPELVGRACRAIQQRRMAESKALVNGRWE